MKKILIFLMLAVFSLTLVKDEVEAEVPVNLFDFNCITPRFMYTTDTNGDTVPLECEFRTLESGLYFDDVVPFDVDFKILDSFGNTIEIVESFTVDYERENVNVTGGYYQYTVTTDSDVSVVDLGSFISGEIKEIRGVENGGIELGVDDWEYDPITHTLVLNTFRPSFTIGDDIDIWFDKYDSTTYVYTYENNYIGYRLESLYEGGIVDDTEYIYQFVFDDRVMYTGMIALSPQYTPLKHLNNNYSIDFGEYYLTDDSLDFTNNVEDFTYSKGFNNYFLLHYEKDPNFSEVLTIKFYDILTGTITDSINTDDIFNYQGGNNDERHRAYIPLTFDGDGQVRALKVDDYFPPSNVPSGIESFNLPVGVYLITLENSSGSLYDYSDYLLIISDVGSQPYSLDLLYEELNLDTSQRVTFSQFEQFDNYFNTIEAKDLGVNNDFSTELNAVNNITRISYKPLDTLLSGDQVNFRWKLEPTSLPHSLDTTQFIMTFTETYTIIEVVTTDSLLINLANYIGLDDNDGLLFLSILLIIIINLVLVFILSAQEVRGYVVYVIINSSLLLLLSSLGWIPNWVGITLGILIGLTLLFLFSRMGGDE